MRPTRRAPPPADLARSAACPPGPPVDEFPLPAIQRRRPPASLSGTAGSFLPRRENRSPRKPAPPVRLDVGLCRAETCVHDLPLLNEDPDEGAAEVLRRP